MRRIVFVLESKGRVHFTIILLANVMTVDSPFFHHSSYPFPRFRQINPVFYAHLFTPKAAHIARDYEKILGYQRLLVRSHCHRLSPQTDCSLAKEQLSKPALCAARIWFIDFILHVVGTNLSAKRMLQTLRGEENTTFSYPSLAFFFLNIS